MTCITLALLERQDSGNIMYDMMHATGHPYALRLMARASTQAVKPRVAGAGTARMGRVDRWGQCRARAV